ncbi:MAG: hypothetical protein OEZ32_10290 [Nitrospinota bacterium]|nr:hypothetical protein [Nitrospinota bacterium]
MKSLEPSTLEKISDRTFHLLLAGGAALVAASIMRFGVAELAWVASAPFLVAMSLRGGRRDHAWLLFYATLSMFGAMAKIITPPIGWPMMLVFAIPSSLVMFTTLFLAGLVFRGMGVTWGIYFFPALTVTVEWVFYTFTPQSSWGAAGLTQVDNLPLVQFASIAGLAGLSFLVALGSSVTAAAVTRGVPNVKKHVVLFAMIFLAAQTYGQLRLANPAPGKRVRVAAVASPLPVEKLQEILADSSVARAADGELFGRTAKAADLGARVVVWNEGATMVEKAAEEAYVARGVALARERGIDIVMAIGVIISRDPFTWENKYHWVRADGSVADVYHKRHPTPGEGPVPGQAHAAVVNVGGAKLSGAICFDYDFPEIALNNAWAGAGLAVIPSSDWKGIDPVHSMMARLQGVAVGISTVRSVRAATSYAADQYGRVTGSMAFESPQGVMVADVPAARVPTLYAATGEVLPWFMALFCGFTLAMAAAGSVARRTYIS